MTMAPAMFVGHGSPMFAIEQSYARQLLEQQQSNFQNIKAIVVLSAHWNTRGYTAISTDAQMQTIHDFGGFPTALYQLQYPARGNPALSLQIQQCLVAEGVDVQLQSNRGLDHGAWVPLMHLVPNASVPVIQVSLDVTASPQQVFRLGQCLAHFRQQGIAIVGSGSITHNLADVKASHDNAAHYAQRFESWVRSQVEQNNGEALIAAADLHPDFYQAHPSAEHYYPLLFALGASQSNDQLKILKGGIKYHALSMESYLWA